MFGDTDAPPLPELPGDGPLQVHFDEHPSLNRFPILAAWMEALLGGKPLSWFEFGRLSETELQGVPYVRV
jgi:hypothetical protein